MSKVSIMGDVSDTSEYSESVKKKKGSQLRARTPRTGSSLRRSFADSLSGCHFFADAGMAVDAPPPMIN